MLVVCVANILLNYAWRWRWRWRWEPVLVLVSVTKTWTRRKCNWTWSGWKAIKGASSTPGCPFLYVPDICNCYVYGIKFQKIFQTLPAFACDTLFSPLCWAYPCSLSFFFFAPGCISNYAKLRAEIITHFGYHLAKVSGLSVASDCPC